jgi:hypothetical protein
MTAASPMVTLPPDLRKVLQEIDAADAAAEALTAGLTDEQFGWPPDGGRRWSVAQCLEHLATANDVYGRAMREAVQRARSRGWTRSGPLSPGFFGRKFVASLEPPVKRRTRAPGKILPRPQRSRADIVRHYHEAHGRIRDLIPEAAEIDANRATFPNPFFGLIRVRVATAFQVIAAHDRRHLWQAEQVINRRDFPGPAPTPR